MGFNLFSEYRLGATEVICKKVGVNIQHVDPLHLFEFGYLLESGLLPAKPRQ